MRKHVHIHDETPKEQRELQRRIYHYVWTRGSGIENLDSDRLSVTNTFYHTEVLMHLNNNLLTLKSLIDLTIPNNSNHAWLEGECWDKQSKPMV